MTVQYRPLNPQFLRKTITFTGGAGAGAIGQITVATPTGHVRIIKILPVCTTLLDDASAGTVSLGRAASVAALIAATLGSTIDSGEYWLDGTPAATFLAIPAALKDFMCSTPITMDVLVAAIASGVLVFDIEYEPVNGGSLA